MTFRADQVKGTEGMHLRVLPDLPREEVETAVKSSGSGGSGAGSGGSGVGQPATGWRSAGGSLPGQVDFHLARRYLVREYKRGRLAQHEVCDAHPELIRAATGVGAETDKVCPICEVMNLVHVTYAFGPGLAPHGKCVYTADDFEKLLDSPRERAAYTVEVCVGCRWNHLARTFVVGGAFGRTRAKRRSVAE